MGSLAMRKESCAVSRALLFFKIGFSFSANCFSLATVASHWEAMTNERTARSFGSCDCSESFFSAAGALSVENAKLHHLPPFFPSIGQLLQCVHGASGVKSLRINASRSKLMNRADLGTPGSTTRTWVEMSFAVGYVSSVSETLFALVTSLLFRVTYERIFSQYFFAK